MQGATAKSSLAEPTFDVSIHAPYAGSDEVTSLTLTLGAGFNPRPLCRERHAGMDGAGTV